MVSFKDLVLKFGFLILKNMQLFDIRSDRQIIALAIKAFKIRNERRNYLKKKNKKNHTTHPGLSLEAFVCSCFIVFLHHKYKGINQLMRAINR